MLISYCSSLRYLYAWLIGSKLPHYDLLTSEIILFMETQKTPPIIHNSSKCFYSMCNIDDNIYTYKVKPPYNPSKCFYSMCNIVDNIYTYKAKAPYNPSKCFYSMCNINDNIILIRLGT